MNNYLIALERSVLLRERRKILLFIIWCFTTLSIAAQQPASVEQEKYKRVILKSWSKSPSNGGLLIFSINTIDVRQPTVLCRIGDTVPSTNLRVISFEEKHEVNRSTGAERDQSELTLKNTLDGYPVVLVLNKVTSYLVNDQSKARGLGPKNFNVTGEQVAKFEKVIYHISNFSIKQVIGNDTLVVSDVMPNSTRPRALLVFGSEDFKDRVIPTADGGQIVPGEAEGRFQEMRELPLTNGSSSRVPVFECTALRVLGKNVLINEKEPQ